MKRREEEEMMNGMEVEIEEMDERVQEEEEVAPFRVPPSVPMLLNVADDDCGGSSAAEASAGDEASLCDEMTMSNEKEQRIREKKLASLWEFFTLRGFFRLFGRAVGSCPLAFFIVGLLFSTNSLWMYRMVLKDRIRDGYTPINAPSRYETDVIRQFWNSTGDPMMTIMMMMARDGGSMHRKAHLDEAASVLRFLHSNFSVPFDDEHLVFANMCEPYCSFNTLFEMFKSGFDAEYALATARNGVASPSSSRIDFPVARVSGFDLHLERTLFGVRINDEQRTPLNLRSLEQNITNMEYVKVVLVIFRGDKGTAKLEKQMSTWELAAYDFSLEQYKSELIELQVVGTEVLDREMIRDGRKMTPFFAAGFGFMISFVSVSVLGSAAFYGEIDRGKLLVAVGATLCPILAITTTYGIVSLLGLRINSFMLVMPFLIMGIGVDDSFLMIHSWQRSSRQGYSVVERLGLVYEQVGPSITITSLTNFLSFSIGALTPTPEIRLFCFATAIAMGITFIFQLVIFGPVLVAASKYEKSTVKTAKEKGGWRLMVERGSARILHLYCRLLGARVFTALIFVATVVYWYFGIIGMMNIKTRLDAAKILPKDSPIQRFWVEYHPVTVLVNEPFNLSNSRQMSRFWEMIDEFETMKHSKGPDSSLIWLRDYVDFFVNGEPYDLMSLLFGVDSGEKRVKADPMEVNVTNDKLWAFLRSPFYEHWTGFLRTRNTSNGPIIDQFWVNVAYNDTSSWETRIDLMQNWREVVSRYKDLNASIWEPNGMFVDQMLSLKTVALQTGLLTLVCMAVVCAIFIPNASSVITAGLSIASISIGVMGFLSWWNFDLDPVVMAAVLMSIGMSVDFTAHVSYHYQLTNRKEIRNGVVVKIPVAGYQEKLEHTLEAVGWPMIQAGLSTIICILPLLFLQSYSPSVFVATIFLVVSWGLLHGLLVLPVILSCIPDCLTNANCYRTFFSTSSEKSCRYTGKDMDEEAEEDQEMQPINVPS